MEKSENRRKKERKRTEWQKKNHVLIKEVKNAVCQCRVHLNHTGAHVVLFFSVILAI